MPPFLSERLAQFEQSDIRAMTKICEKVGGINLGQGLCDLPTHPLVEQGAIEAIQTRQNTYSYAEGSEILRGALAKKLARDNQLQVDPNQNICVTVGASGGFTCAMTALLNPGDGILLFEPYYGYHRNAAILAGIEPQYHTLEPPDFSFTETELREAIRPNTRAIMICTPSNPCGKMFSRPELEVIATVANEYNLLVLTDEIYEYIRFDNTPHISPASVPELWDRSISIMGVSKTFSITGWRLGYTVGPAEFIKSIALVNDIYSICAPTPLQLGVAKGYEAPVDYFHQLATSYQTKRDILCPALERSGLTPITPKGAYYVLADISRLGFPTAKEAALHLLDTIGVAAVPGSAFFNGDIGENYLRFCFAKDEDSLREAAEKLETL